MIDQGDGKEGTGALVRGLMRGARTAALSTALAGEAGRPYVSLVLTASAPDGSPLLLLSALAEHSKNLKADARLALLYDGTADLASPLEGARASVVGRLAPAPEPMLRARFLARHPEAEAYAGFRDFSFHRVILDRVHLVAGFGRIRWMEAKAVLIAAPPALTHAEPDILQHMNADHGDAVRLYATRLLDLPDGPWTLCGIDAEGCDLRCGGRYGRVDFARRIETPDEARVELVRLAKDARTTT
jgi:putative heme iron utilization protein